MKVLVYGGTSGAGRLFTEGALASGHEVTAFARRADALQSLRQANLRLVVGDARDPAAVAAAVPGHDAVVCLLGPHGMQRFRPFVARATRAFVEAMERHRVPRLLFVSAVGVGESRAEAPALFRYFVIPFLLRTTFADRAQAEAVVQSSRLEWTIVRPLYLTNEPPTGRVRTAADGRDVPPRLARGDLAKVLLDELVSTAHLRQAIAVGTET